MGLKSDIQSALAAAFDSNLSDAVKQLTYTKIESTYNPIIGETIITETTYNTRGVLDKERAVEIFNQSYKPQDTVILILQNELNTIPDIDDYIEENGNKWKIIAIKNDPADVTWELLCRI